MRIKKRDETIQQFKSEKIKRALLMAFNAVRSDKIADVDVICDHVVETLRVNSGNDIVQIEEVQDQVEKSLIAFNAAKVAKAFILYREEHARRRAIRLVPDVNALQDYIHPAKYGKYIPQLKRRETYGESCLRVVAMLHNKFPDQTEIIDSCHREMLAKRILPSMRCMQFAGDPVRQHNARMYNCSFTHMDRVEAFSEAFYLLLCGCGVGYSVQFRHVRELPVIKKINKRHVVHYNVPDSIEGWSASVDLLLYSYTQGDYIEFNYSAIRDEGKPLKSGGKAPGHIPLKTMHNQVRAVLDKAANRHLRPIEVHDIMCYIAEAVLSGGIRRSSLIALFSNDDGEMMMAKMPENFEHNGLNAQRAMANNSAVFLRERTTEQQFRRVMDINRTNPNGEPGFFFTNSLEYGCNPCGEIGLNPKLNGETGFAFCNLTEVNVAACKAHTDFIHAAICAAYLGTFQATYTDFKVLTDVSKHIAEREALIGVGLTGLADNPTILEDEKLLHNAAREVVNANEQLAMELGINAAARCTTIKPSGTASLS